MKPSQCSGIRYNPIPGDTRDARTIYARIPNDVNRVLHVNNRRGDSSRDITAFRESPTQFVV